MAKAKKTLDNPNGLTAKQRLSAEIMAQNIVDGKGARASEAHGAVYSVKDNHSARAISNQNLRMLPFRMEIIDGLKARGLLGIKGKLQMRLAQGLDAMQVSSNKPAWGIRLAYIKEINKILGVHAPTQIDQRNLNLRATVSPKELHANISGLEGELAK